MTFTYTKKDPNTKTLSGKVTDYTTGAAISGATVIVEYTGGSKSATTAGDGSYSFDLRDVPKTDLEVNITKSGYISRENNKLTHPGGDLFKDFAILSTSDAASGIILKRYKVVPKTTVHSVMQATAPM